MQRVVLVVVAWLALLASAHAQPKLPEKTDRVVATSRLWAKVKFFHPYLAYKDIDWDAAFVATLPKVEAATTIDEYRKAIAGMLAPLKDPVTGIARTFPTPAKVTGEFLSVDKDVVTIDLARYTSTGDWKADQVIAALASTKRAVIDVRGIESWTADRAIDGFLAALPAIPRWPEARYLEHRGFATQEGMSSGGYETVFVTSGARAATKAPAKAPSHVVFVVDEATTVPSAAVALRAAGRASVVSSAPLVDERNVLTTTVDLGGGIIADVRLAEPLWGPPVADVVAKGDLRVRAIALARSAPPKPRASAIELPPIASRDELDYADTAFPSRALRVLSAVRVWATLAHFNPYQYLVRDWDRAFVETLAAVDAATDATGYLRAMQAFAARVGDGHANVWTAKKPRERVDISVRMIGSQLVVTMVPPQLAKDLSVGDVIETVDGVATDKALAALRPFTSGSTEEARTQRTASQILVGDPGSSLVLGVRGAKGPARSVTLVRGSTARAGAPTTPAWKKLAGAIGYVDLRRLEVGEIDPMLAELGASKAIIFDMRGYPRGTAWALAPRLNKQHAEFGAQFLQPIVLHGQEAKGTSRRFFQPIPENHGGEPYRGKVVVLIDDRAISQAEHTCLFLQEAADAMFIGSPTHGANGDVTTFKLPGGLRMWFTGQEVRHVNGTQLQKVGIVPDITVRPTLAGIRAGKDEVLDRALAWIATGK